MGDTARSWTRCCGMQHGVGLAAVGYSAELDSLLWDTARSCRILVGYSAVVDSILWDTARSWTRCCGIQLDFELLAVGYSVELNS